MAITKTTLFTRIRQMSDTTNETVDYPTVLISDFASIVFVDEWKKILGAAPYYRTARRSVAVDSEGRFLVTALNTSTSTVFRLLQVRGVDGRDFTYTAPSQLNILDDLTQWSDRVWTRVGDEIQLTGVKDATITVLVNYIPLSPNHQDDDAAVIDFPDNYEPILYYEAGALVLSKAGREMNDAVALQAMAERLRDKMLSDVRRDAAEPSYFVPNDGAWEWGQ